MSNLTDADREALGRIIWETSRADESTISYAGANIVADAVLVSDWFQARVAEARAEAWDKGYVAGHSIAMRRMSDEPNAPTPRNPFREGADR